jgi:acylphosphatase
MGVRKPKGQAQNMRRRIHLRITGRVQGVCYRAYALDKAQSIGLTGTVRNLDDGSVELVAEGEEPALTSLLDWCWEGSPWAQVAAIDARWSDATDEHTTFRVDTSR